MRERFVVRGRRALVGVLLSGLLVAAGGGLLGLGCGHKALGRVTVATIEVVRTPVEISGGGSSHFVGGDERLAEGHELRVPDKAQALLRHDQGARILVDGGSELEITEAGAVLRRGRAWVDARAGTTMRLDAAGFALVASGVGAGFEVRAADKGAQIVVIRGEVAWQGQPQRGVVRAGEQLTLAAGDKQMQPQPVVLWDDWTGGLGWPDPRRSRGAAGVGEVGARRPGDLGEARFPLSVQRLQVRTRIEDDLAVTTVEQTFFNPADTTLEGIFRVRLPEGAILSRFAIDRRGRLVDGYVKERETAQRQYQAQVYEGSTHDPALLEWEAPGSFKARLYPLPPGSTRRVLFTYSEWLKPHGPGAGLRTFRYPMGGTAGASAPLIQELDVEVDAGSAGADELRAGLGALVAKDGRRVVLQRTDYVPSADLVVELVGAARPEDVARVYRVPHQVPSRPGAKSAKSESDYVLIRALPVSAPAAAERSPLDLVLLIDVSAATDATHLAMARTLLESMLRRLTPEDRVVLLGADLDAHELAPAAPAKGAPATPQLLAATPDNVRAVLARLGRSATGGATDLGAALSQAAGLLQPDRLGAVLYVGDAQPTVGELDLKALRERLGRLPAPLRLYGVGIGDDANLDLLSELAQSSAGRAFRVSDRAAAAETALSIVTHLSRPAASRVKIDIGAGLDRVYPRQDVSLLAGEPLFILARLRSGAPQSVTVTGTLSGQPFKRSFRVETHSLDDTADLRLRWSQARLDQFLEEGASTEEVAELGVRQNLITPYTSFYVPSEDEVSLLEKATPEVRAAGCSYERAPSATAASPAPTEEAPAWLRQASDNQNSGARRGAEMKKEAPSEEGRMQAADAPVAPGAAPPPMPEPSAAMPAMEASAAPAPKAASRRAAAPMREEEKSADKGAPRKPTKDDSPSDGFADAMGGGFGITGTGRGGGGGYGSGTIGLGNLGTIGRGSSGTEDLRKNVRAAKKRRERSVSADEMQDRPEPSTVVTVQDGDVTVLVGVLRHRPRGCSAASSQPLDERRDLWRERLGMGSSVRRALEVFQDAERGCELPRWTDRRELLKLMLRSCGGPSGMVSLYKHFDDQPEEQEYLRQAILGVVKTPRDLRVIYDGLGLGDEERATLAQEVVRNAKTADERLRRVADLLRRWPGDMRLRLLKMATEEELGRAEAARRTAEEVRRDPYADAQARTAVGELYVRLGDEAAARRAFSEIVEFAPRDPLARRRLGDLYRAHGWFDEAYRQYQTLLTLEPSDQSVLLLLAMAAAGAGHIEEALGLEQRVIGTAEPGSASGLSRTALLSSGLRLAQLRAEARSKSDSESLARLLLRARQTGAAGLARPVRVFVTWAHPEADLELKVAEDGSFGPATELAPQFGLLGWASSPDQSASAPLQIEVSRGASAGALTYPVELTVVVSEGDPAEQVWRVPIQLDAQHGSRRFALRGGKLSPVE